MQTFKAYSESIFMYAADQQLASLLLNFGLIETTSKLDDAKGKRRFRKTLNARKSIYFHGKIIQVFTTHPQEEKTTISIEELRRILLFLELAPIDWREIDHKGLFDFEKSKSALERIESELKNLIAFNLNYRRQNKLARIIARFEKIKRVAC